MKPREIRELDTYLGLRPFDVLIDESDELKLLVEKTRTLKSLSFNDKLKKIKELALTSMENAYEDMLSHPDPERRKLMERIVMEEHPLSEALRHKAGCCRYQGVLFFVLGFEAKLGSRHILQSANVRGNTHTVFNDVYDNNGILYRTNIFTESLKDKKYDYSNVNPRLYDDIDVWMPGVKFYSYHKKGENVVILESLDFPVWHV